MKNKTLLLDKNYLVVSIISIRKAANLMTRGKVESVTDQSFIVQTGSSKFKIPTILRLVNPIPYRTIEQIRFSRKNIMIRDNYTCQYCLKKLGKYSGTIDHVIPKSKGGGSDYANCVASCHDCNNFKANRTPEEADMILKQIPRKPNFVSINRNSLQNMPMEWKNYLIGA